MNKNTFLGFFFIVLILIGFSWYNAPSKETLEKQKLELQAKEALKLSQQKDSLLLDSIRKIKAVEKDSLELKDTATSANNSKLDNSILKKFGSFSGISKGTKKDYIIENDKLKLKISTKGGSITYAEVKNYKTYDSLPLVLFNNETASMSFLLNDQRLETKDLYFEPVVKNGALKDSTYISGDQKYTIAMRAYPVDNAGNIDKSKFLEFEYVIKGNDYMVDFHMNMQGMSNIIAPGLNDIPLYWNMKLEAKEKDPAQEVKKTTIYYKYTDEDVDYLSETKKENSKELDTKVQWISFSQQFFSTTIISPTSFAKGKIKQNTAEENLNSKDLKTMHAEMSVPLSSSVDFQSIPFQIYMGPNKYDVLKEYHLELERQVPIGWGFFLLAWINKGVIIIFNFLGSFGWNYGIIILIITVLLKFILFPIAYKTYISSAKMRVLKPELDEISAQFPKKEDAVKKQQATMTLYKKAGVNPMAGCIPMLLQAPILFALFRFFPSAIELRQQSFLWADDLSSYDSIFSWSQHIPILSTYYGNHISLFTLLMTVSTILYTNMNNQMMSSSQQMPGMKAMMYLMPIMFLGFFNNYSAGLSYYYFLANMITFGQMYLMRRFVDEKALHAKIQENKKKPIKKSNFQKKLEEMAKQKK